MTDRTSPERRILINGAAIPPELDADVLAVTVAQYADGGNRFDVLVNALDSTDQSLKWIDSDHARPGNELTIELGYMGQLTRVLVGEIVAVRVTYSNDQAAQLHIQGFDRLHRLRRGRRTRVYSEMKDSQIAEQIASELELQPQVTDSSVVHPYVLQNNLSNIDFLMDRARRIHYEVRVEDKTLFFRPVSHHLAETVVLEYMRDLKWFNVRLSTARQVSDVSVRGWNPATKESIVGSAEADAVSTRMKGDTTGPELADEAFGSCSDATVDVPVTSQGEADQIAEARINALALELTAGEGEAVGDPALQAGNTIELRGLGDRFSGAYYVIKSEHRLAPDLGYVTRFDVRRNAS
jgi:uncharacterized protein